MIYELTKDGYFICDSFHHLLPEFWTSTPCSDGLTNGRLVGAKLTKATGEFKGGEWVGDSDVA
jgi:hypothetical protein